MFAHESSPGDRFRRIPLVTIDKVVAARLGQTRVQGNAQPAVFNRQVAMYLARHVGGWSTTRIGKFYNGRDHSTVCHALKKVEMLRNSQPEIDELLADLKSEIVSEGRGNSAAPRNDIGHPEPRAGEVILTDEFLDLVVDRLLDRLRSPKRRTGEQVTLPR
jgi:Bacterial dnaA protein helix-turn-helix